MLKRVQHDSRKAFASKARTEKMKIAFFGTSDRSIPILNTLSDSFSFPNASSSNLELVLCITKQDSKVGRHHITKETAVKTWAKSHNIPSFCIEKLDNEGVSKLTSFACVVEQLKIVELLKSSAVDVGVVADFSLILKQEIVDTPPFKLINIHFSLLPKYRGASPVQFAILNGDKKTGISFYLMDKNMDTGKILAQVEYTLTGNETSGELYKTLFDIAAKKLPNVITEYVGGKITPVPQDESLATYTYSKTHPKNTFIYKEDAQIDWSKDIEYIKRAIRAYNPWPISWSTLSDLDNSQFLREKGLKIRAGANKSLKIKFYELDEVHDVRLRRWTAKVQVEGGKILSWKDFENGYLVVLRHCEDPPLA